MSTGSRSHAPIESSAGNPQRRVAADGDGTPPLKPFIHLLRKEHGLDLARFDETFLEKTLRSRLMATASAGWKEYADLLKQEPAEANALLASLSIGYSEFFRNPLTFALLEQVVLPALVADKERSGQSELRIWSAGCAAGQEAYSVAMLLEDLAALRERPVPFRIFATDVSPDALALAQEGVYDRAAVQNVRLRHLQAYFTIDGNAYAVAPGLRKRVDFSTFDLLDDSSVSPPACLYGDFDLVLCCNLLFYYGSDIRLSILGKVCRALSPGGYFVTGEAERDVVSSRKLLRAVAPPAAVFRKAVREEG